MTRQDHSRLLSALWRMGLFVGETLVGADGESVVVLSQGETTESPERFAGARVVLSAYMRLHKLTSSLVHRGCTGSLVADLLAH